MNTKILFFATLFLAAATQSCKKDEEHDHEDVEVNISIASPTNTMHLHLNDNLDIIATISSNIEIHGYEATLKNLTADSTVWSMSEHEHGTSYSINGSWINDVVDISTMQLTIVAEVDHDGTTETKTVSFMCLPQ